MTGSIAAASAASSRVGNARAVRQDDMPVLGPQVRPRHARARRSGGLEGFARRGTGQAQGLVQVGGGGRSAGELRTGQPRDLTHQVAHRAGHEPVVPCRERQAFRRDNAVEIGLMRLAGVERGGGRVDVQLLGDQHGLGRGDALAHIGARHDQRDAVRRDLDEGGQRGLALGQTIQQGDLASGG